MGVSRPPLMPFWYIETDSPAWRACHRQEVVEALPAPLRAARPPGRQPSPPPNGSASNTRRGGTLPAAADTFTASERRVPAPIPLPAAGGGRGWPLDRPSASGVAVRRSVGRGRISSTDGGWVGGAAGCRPLDALRAAAAVHDRHAMAVWRCQWRQHHCDCLVAAPIYPSHCP